ncbi:MAG: sulfite exporter TauE/SafE family protein [Candidatus Eremiobacteraeota bacterium]|nr:sulfite exporter TauE/SafE family protein [Candidatus Eremiobacteraeota bacterium]MBV8460723.1 sulfite exporter TauE/SafE family protein [Candidatus Eremiobacteraeota bacterium]MBV8671083.1 sulfite exporter TauE/SafE family protein [Candidatus Eremiobacteraeota bacterium]
MTPFSAAAFVLLGLVAGTYGTIVGVGGGIFIVPVLLMLHVPPKEAAGTSMAVVCANALSGSVAFLRQRRIDLRSTAIFAVAGIPGAVAGGFADQIVPPKLFSMLFAALLTIAGVRFLLRPGHGGDGTPAIADRAVTAGFRPGWAIAIGLVAGFFASVLGVGGGIIYVPTMSYLFAFPAHVATATSTSIIALTALVATASHTFYHDVRWLAAVLLAIGAVAGAQLGARIAPRIRAPGLLRLFALAMLLTAAWLFYRALATPGAAGA